MNGMKPSRPMAQAVSAPEENEAPAAPGANCFLAEKSSYGNRLVFSISIRTNTTFNRVNLSICNRGAI
jgi:hypothetical protein